MITRKNYVLGILFLVGLLVSRCVRKETSPQLAGPYLGQTPPGMTPELFAPGIISHGFHENGIIFSADGTEIYYSTSDSKYSSKTFMVLKMEENQWSAPELASFSGNYYNHSAFFSPDGKRIYFSSLRPVPPSTESKKELEARARYA